MVGVLHPCRDWLRPLVHRAIRRRVRHRDATQYDAFSRVNGLEFGTLGKKVYLTRAYDELTGRMTRQVSSRDLAPKSIDDTTYTYDDAGNITSLTTASGQDTDRTVDTQCFTNDALQRLTQAWTTTTDCNAAPAITGSVRSSV
ncbi:hypothetical protein ABTX34_27280 [Streptomyces sp. NPDC096538]|uniref:hypothetical protein n=1 Tax=Streptomyces sp. NPDC096538 TaxID=3155427 RepID=UPI00332880DE